MEFLVEFEVHVPAGRRLGSRSARRPSHPPRPGWQTRATSSDCGEPPRVGDTKAIGLYRAGSEAQLDALLSDLPLYDWLRVTVTPLEPHPNDPHPGAVSRAAGSGMRSDHLPAPRRPVFRLEATLGEALDLGESRRGRRRIVPLTSGSFTGPGSTERCSRARAPTGRSSSPTAPRSGTSATRCRPRRALSSMCGRAAFVMPARGPRAARAGREGRPRRVHLPRRDPDRDRSRRLDWLNKGVFISVGGRQANGVSYETYLVE